MDFKLYTDVQNVPIDSIKSHPLNDKVHSDNKLNALKKAIKYNGFDHPIVVNSITRVISDGHARWEAAKRLKLKVVPVIFKDYDSDDHQLIDLKLHNEVSLIDMEYNPAMTAMINQKVGDQLNRAISADYDSIEVTKKKIKETLDEVQKKLEDETNRAIQDKIEQSKQQHQEYKEAVASLPKNDSKPTIETAEAFNQVVEQEPKSAGVQNFVVILNVNTKELKEALKNELKTTGILNKFNAKIY